MKKSSYNSILIVVLIAGQFSFLYGQQETGLSQGPVITVGINGADINGSDNRAIQAAVDMMYQRGGGTVQILPGEYILQDAIRLHSDIHLIGDREKTILKHAPAVSSQLLKDADIGQKEVTPENPSFFRVGMGIVCRDSDLPNEMVNKPLTIINIENGVLHLSGYIEFDFNADFDRRRKGEKVH